MIPTSFTTLLQAKDGRVSMTVADLKEALFTEVKSSVEELLKVASQAPCLSQHDPHGFATATARAKPAASPSWRIGGPTEAL